MSASLLYTLVLAALLLVSVPLFVLLGVATALGFVVFGDVASLFDVTIVENVRELTDKPPLLAIPFFVISGTIMSRGAIAQRLVAVAKSVFSPLPGGLAVATVAASLFFAAISGSSPVTVITIGSVMYPALVKAGYSERFSIGLVTSAGTLGILIPPSIPMIVYAIFASAESIVRVEDLFLAGVGPGLLIGALMAGVSVVVGLRMGERFSRPKLREIAQSMSEGFWSLMLPGLILGGIYSGIFTATEAAAVSVVYALVVELFIHRQLKVSDIAGVIAESTILMGSLLVIFAMAMGLNALLTELQIPERAASAITSMQLTPLQFILLLNGFLLLVGCLMDIISAIMILVPLLVPMASLCGVDPIHLGIIFIVNLELGYLTPPMGLNLFVSSSVFNKSLGMVIRSTLPFGGLLLAAVLIVSYVPTVPLGPVNVLNNKPFYEPFPSGEMCVAPDGGGALDDDDDAEDDDAEGAGQGGPKSINELMKGGDYLDLLDDDDDDEDDDDDSPPDNTQKSINELMKGGQFLDLLDEEAPERADP